MSNIIQCCNNRNLEALCSRCKVARSLLQEGQEKIINRYKDLEDKKNDLMKTNKGIIKVRNSDYIIVNAGGELIPVRRNVLTKIAGSRLEAIFSGRWENKLMRDEDGNIFMDINPSYFRSIIQDLQGMVYPYHSDPQCHTSIRKERNDAFDSFLLSLGLHEHRIEDDKKDCSICIDSTILDGLERERSSALDRFLLESNVDGHLDLLYRASRDGWGGTDFHSKCDGKGATVTLIKDTKNNVFGGFTDVAWNTPTYGKYRRSPKAFIFYLRFGSDQSPAKMKQISSNDKHAVYHDINYGPSFGNYDITVESNANENEDSYTEFGYTYECPKGQKSEEQINFQADEIEVYAVSGSKKRKMFVPPKRTSNKLNHIKPKEKEQWVNMKFDDFPDQLKYSLEQEQNDLVHAWNDIKKLERDFDYETMFMESFLESKTDDLVHFNVQGNTISTRRSTILQFPDSVLASEIKSKIATVKNDKEKQSMIPVQDWCVAEVVEWVTNEARLPLEVSDALGQHKIKGNELLAFEREDWKAIGIGRVGTIALIMKAIQELKSNVAGSKYDGMHMVVNTTNKYCFCKMLDQLRVRAMFKALKWVTIVKPDICKTEQDEFKKLIQYYFPRDDEALKWLTI